MIYVWAIAIYLLLSDLGQLSRKQSQGQDSGRLHGGGPGRHGQPFWWHPGLHLDRLGEPLRRCGPGVSPGLLGPVDECRCLAGPGDRLLPGAARCAASPSTRCPTSWRPATTRHRGYWAADRHHHRLPDHRQLSVHRWWATAGDPHRWAYRSDSRARSSSAALVVLYTIMAGMSLDRGARSSSTASDHRRE